MIVFTVHHIVNSILLKVLNYSIIPFCEVFACLKQTHNQEGKCAIFLVICYQCMYTLIWVLLIVLLFSSFFLASNFSFLCGIFHTVRTGLEGPGLTVAQKIWYCVATVGGQYIWARLQSFSAFRRWGDTEQVFF